MSKKVLAVTRGVVRGAARRDANIRRLEVSYRGGDLLGCRPPFFKQPLNDARLLSYLFFQVHGDLYDSRSVVERTVVDI